MQHLLLLHGAIGSKDQFNALEDELKDCFIVHSINFSGHGGEVMIDEFSIENFSQNILNYLSSKNIDSINIFGYSMGGYVAMYLARYHPKKINRIFTFATKFYWSEEISQREIKMLDPTKISEKIPAFAQILEKRHLPNDWKSVLEKTAKMMHKMGITNPLSIDDYELITNIIKVGIGDKDNMVTMEETIDVYKSLPNASFVVLQDTQHPIEKINLERLKKEIELFFLEKN